MSRLAWPDGWARRAAALLLSTGIGAAIPSAATAHSSEGARGGSAATALGDRAVGGAPVATPHPSGIVEALCAPDPEPPPYYAFPLVTTRRVPGTGQAKGLGEVTFTPSPFGVSMTADGSYELEVRLTFDGLRPPTSGAYVVWLTTPELDRVERAGALDPGGPFRARVGWNKFLVVVTLEEEADPEAATWSGPVVIRGMSRSGMMHTMAGHGPFEKENCARYGY